MAVWGVHTGYFSPHVPILLINLLVFALVCWAHVPVETVLQPQVIIIVVDLFKLCLSASQGAVRLHKMCFRFGDHPVWQ